MKALAPVRVRGRAHAARRLKDTSERLVAEGDAGCTLRALGTRINVSHTRMERLAGDGAPAVAVGDVEAMGPRFARAYCVRWLADLDDPGTGPSARDTLDSVAIELGVAIGDLHRDLAADGCEDEHAKHADRFLRIAQIAMRGASAARRRAGSAP